MQPDTLVREPRIIKQSRNAARRHTWLIGPTGTGKTGQLINLALADLEQGTSVIPWVDPKDGRGANALLARIPEKYADRVVLLDANRTDYYLGLNVMEAVAGGRQDVTIDQIVSVFAGMFKENWGSRQAEFLYRGLKALFYHEDMTLPDLSRLFRNDAFRLRIVKGIKDADERDWWLNYETAPHNDVLPLLSRLGTLFVRPGVKYVLGQRKSTVDLADILNNGGIVVANLPLELGDISKLLGSILLLRIWQVVQGRQGQSDESKLREASATLDEGYLFVHIGKVLEQVLDTGRSAHWGVTFANQRMGQLTDGLKEALDANALTKAVFRPSTIDNAKAVSGLVPGVSIDALLQLADRQMVVKFPDERPFVGRTIDLPDPVRDPKDLADRALKNFGRPAELVEHDVQDRFKGQPEFRDERVDWTL